MQLYVIVLSLVWASSCQGQTSFGVGSDFTDALPFDEWSDTTYVENTDNGYYYHGQYDNDHTLSRSFAIDTTTISSSSSYILTLSYHFIFACHMEDSDSATISILVDGDTESTQTFTIESSTFTQSSDNPWDDVCLSYYDPDEIWRSKIINQSISLNGDDIINSGSDNIKISIYGDLSTTKDNEFWVIGQISLSIVFQSSSPTSTPTEKPSNNPSNMPSTKPSMMPSTNPSSKPTNLPSVQPSGVPSINPSSMPTNLPSILPSNVPSTDPSLMPSRNPSSEPSMIPTSIPSNVPSSTPTTIPSMIPTTFPTSEPTSFNSVCSEYSTNWKDWIIVNDNDQSSVYYHDEVQGFWIKNMKNADSEWMIEIETEYSLNDEYSDIGDIRSFNISINGDFSSDKDWIIEKENINPVFGITDDNSFVAIMIHSRFLFFLFFESWCFASSVQTTYFMFLVV